MDKIRYEDIVSINQAFLCGVIMNDLYIDISVERISVTIYMCIELQSNRTKSCIYVLRKPFSQKAPSHMLFQIPFCVCKMLLIKAGLERFFFENNNRYLFSSQSSGRISIILVGKEKPREIECSDYVMLIKETSYLSLSNSKNRKYRIGFYS